MIKVSFRSANAADDICNILEISLTNQMEIEQWLMEQVQTIQFDSMDFPHDLEAFYDCYFNSGQEETDARKIYHLLERSLTDMKQVLFSVYIVDNQMNQINEIGIF
ncbi:MAG: hypothetical protein K2L38_13440 [Dysosmobacter sp.]|nr:hypothetical protein [Dysosmobacter sp.]